jgi:DNA-binding transcriptional ArsR family regulator
MMQKIQIDKVIHEPARLTILANLYPNRHTDFVSLMRQTGLSWGNLSAHINKLEQVNYLIIKKEFQGRKPHTLLCLSEIGKAAFRNYLTQMGGMLEKLRE